MHYGISDFTTFILGTILIVLLPGPNSLYVMTVAAQRGIAAGYRGAAGIFAGDTVLMLLSATGIASVLQGSPLLFTVLKYAGGAYLSWLGIALLRAALRTWRGTQPGAARRLTLSLDRPFRTALLVSLTNPKAILFFISFFIQFVSPDYPYPALSFLILGLLVQSISALYLSALILGGTYLKRQFGERRWLSAGTSGAVGLLFIGFGVKLASATL